MTPADGGRAGGGRAGAAAAAGKARPRLAKLTRPSLAVCYARTRLFDLIDRPQAPAVVWLAGPPGSGKTTLVADYAARQPGDCLWYQLDRGDADVASFFHYVGEAAEPLLHGQSLPPFQPEHLGNLEAFSRRFFRELYARLAFPCLVLDNYQELAADSPLHAVIRDALAEVPHGGRVLVVSRSDPPAAFASLRARGRLDLIGWNELRLTAAECRGIAERRGLTLDEAELEELHARTQGWAAGVVLLLTEQRAHPRAGGRDLAGTPAVIFDYLAEEIFLNYDATTQEFLLGAAYLPQITQSMAARLGLPEESRAAMRAIGRSDFLITVRHVEPEPIYQLHPLLREFLLARAEQTGTAAQIEARKREAAAVLAEHEHTEAAAGLLIGIRDYDALHLQIARNADALLAQGRSQILERWILALPAERRGADPWLLYWLGACRFPFAPREARELFVAAYRQFVPRGEAGDAGTLAALNGVLEAILHDSDDYRPLDDWLETASRLTRERSAWPSPAFEARMTCNLFVCMALRQPSHPDLAYWRPRTLEVSQLQRDPNVRIGIDASLASLSAWHGQFAGALRLLDGLRELVARADTNAVAAISFAQAEAFVYMLTGDGARGVEAARRGLAIVAESGVRIWNETFLATGLWCALAGRDLDAAAEWVAQIEAKPPLARNFDSHLRAFGLAWYAMLRGDAFLAHQHLKAAGQAAANIGLPGLHAFTGAALAQVLHDGGDERGAWRELERVEAGAADVRSRLLDFLLALTRASFELERGRRAEAEAALRSGLALGRERGFMHFPWWLPQRMARLCEAALDADIEGAYVRRLIAERALLPQPPPYAVRDWPWRFRIRAFGAFRVEAGVAEFGGSAKRAGRPVELLKALVALGGRRVGLAQLAETLWPIVDRDYSSRSLNTTLHRLRRLLGEEAALLVQSGELRLNPAYFWVDTWACEQACEQTLALARGGGAADELVAAAQRALGFYEGPLLAADRSVRWTVAPREHYRGLLLRALEAAAAGLAAAGRTDEVIGLYRLAAEREPHGEAFWRALMQRLADAGRGAEAIDAYLQLRAALEAERHAPSAATEELYRRLAR